VRTLPEVCADAPACARRDEPPVESLAFAPGGRLLAVGLADGTVRLWDPVRGDTLRLLPGQGSPVRSLAFSPDGARLATGDWSGRVRLWESGSWWPLRDLAGDAPALALAFAPTGGLLAVGSWGGAALWDEADGNRRREVAHPPGVQQLLFMGQGETLATAAGEGPLGCGGRRPVRRWAGGTAPMAPRSSA
jgi:hypothetical protein